MVDYKELYFHLFGVMANAVEELEKQNAGEAKELLIAAMREAEEKYIESEQGRIPTPPLAARNDKTQK